MPVSTSWRPWLTACTIILATGAAGTLWAQDQRPKLRLTSAELDSLPRIGASQGTSGVAGIETSVVTGAPAKPGLYSILLRVPAHTEIAAHTHPDDRVATVLSGTWYFGYGTRFDRQALKALPPGSIYAEPPGVAHFARTGDSAVVVQITGVGPTGTRYLDPHADPTRQSSDTSH